MANIEFSDAFLLAEKRKSENNRLRRSKRQCCNAPSTISLLENQVAALSTHSSSSRSSTSSEDSCFNEQSNNFYADYIEDFLQDELLSADDIGYEDLQSSSKTTHDVPSHSLHYHTELKTVDFCRSILLFIRKCNLSKTHVKDLLDVIHSALPQPNFLPKTLNNLVEMVSSKLYLLYGIFLKSSEIVLECFVIDVRLKIHSDLLFD